MTSSQGSSTGIDDPSGGADNKLCGPTRRCPARHTAQRGLSEGLAREVARELTDHDVIRAHARDELGIDIDDLANPLQVGWQAGLSRGWGGVNRGGVVWSGVRQRPPLFQ